jgi:hypothetical protein
MPFNLLFTKLVFIAAMYCIIQRPNRDRSRSTCLDGQLRFSLFTSVVNAYRFHGHKHDERSKCAQSNYAYPDNQCNCRLIHLALFVKAYKMRFRHVHRVESTPNAHGACASHSLLSVSPACAATSVVCACDRAGTHGQAAPDAQSKWDARPKHGSQPQGARVQHVRERPPRVPRAHWSH